MKTIFIIFFLTLTAYSQDRRERLLNRLAKMAAVGILAHSAYQLIDQWPNTNIAPFAGPVPECAYGEGDHCNQELQVYFCTGHSFVGLSGEDEESYFGFYPKGSINKLNADIEVPGIIVDEALMYTSFDIESCKIYRTPVSRGIFEHLTDFVHDQELKVKNNELTYTLWRPKAKDNTGNCLDFVHRVYRETGHQGYFLGEDIKNLTIYVDNAIGEREMSHTHFYLFMQAYGVDYAWYRLFKEYLTDNYH